MNRVLLVTGGSRGIGAATAVLAGARGYAVCVNYKRTREAAEAVVETIQAAGGQAIAVAADVASENDVVRLFQCVDDRLGRIDALVNNAGILQRQANLVQVTKERLRQVFDTNVLGSFLCAREAVKRMSPDRGGAGGVIVNVSSVASRLGAPGEYVDYAASKAAIDTMTIGLAKEVAAQGIRVNAVRPGIIDTEIHASGGEPDRVQRISNSVPMRRGGTATEVAKAILWLLSEEASYTTGSFIDVSGGR